MNNSELNEQLISEFITIAGEYCRALNCLHQFTVHGFATLLLRILPILYIKALNLPLYEDYDRDSVEKFVTEEEWTRVKLQLSKMFGKTDKFNEQIGRFENNQTETISENLADIYQDLKDFTQLVALGIDDTIAEGVGEVKYNFEQYWGQRLLNSLKIIHHLYFNNKFSKQNVFEQQ